MDMLRAMRPEFMRLRVTSQTHKDMCTDKETWYKTLYKQDRIEAARMEAWMAAPVSEGLTLPEPNPFIASDFALRQPVAPPKDEPVLDDMEVSDPATAAAVDVVAQLRTVAPTVVRNDDKALLFFAPDTLFGKPKLQC